MENKDNTPPTGHVSQPGTVTLRQSFISMGTMLDASRWGTPVPWSSSFYNGPQDQSMLKKLWKDNHVQIMYKEKEDSEEEIMHWTSKPAALWKEIRIEMLWQRPLKKQQGCREVLLKTASQKSVQEEGEWSQWHTPWRQGWVGRVSSRRPGGLSCVQNSKKGIPGKNRRAFVL